MAEKGYAFIIEVHPDAGLNSTFDQCLTEEQMRIILVALGGYQLTREELADIRPAYLALLKQWARVYGKGR